MKDSIELTIFTPEKHIKIGEVKEIIIKSEDGSLAILPNHVPMVADLKPTVTKFIDVNDQKKNIFTSTGIIRFMENKADIICDASEWPQDIDLKRAQDAKERAEKRLSEKQSSTDIARAELALVRAIARIKAKH